MKILETKPLYAYSGLHRCSSCQSKYTLEQEDIEAGDTCRGYEFRMNCPVCDAYLQVYCLADYQKRAIRDGKVLLKRPEPERGRVDLAVIWVLLSLAVWAAVYAWMIT